jgi:hypothetical protein
MPAARLDQRQNSGGARSSPAYVKSFIPFSPLRTSTPGGSASRRSLLFLIDYTTKLFELLEELGENFYKDVQINPYS